MICNHYFKPSTFLLKTSMTFSLLKGIDLLILLAPFRGYMVTSVTVTTKRNFKEELIWTDFLLLMPRMQET